MTKIYGQSTKESYRDDIEASRKQKTVYKNFEYFDDYSYSNSKAMGFYLTKDEDEDETSLYFFQDDGPKEENILRKFLEWRRSGKSSEIGHKGGGNKRNIYGFYCSEVFISMKIDEKYVIRCITKPNKLYEAATSDIDEEQFRAEADSSYYITNPEKLKNKNLPTWYNNVYEKIKSESNISPNFLIRLDLTEIPKEYSSQKLWREYINQIRAKQYKIPIYFKNELLHMESYESYEPIDLLGINDENKIKDTTVKLFINKLTKKFFIIHENKYVDVEEQKITNENMNDLIEWGEINMFIVTKDYLSSQLKEFNNNDNPSLKQEDIYGIYLLLNDKLTNYLPFEGKLLGESKNNGICVEEGQKNNSKFRMIFKPNIKNCECRDIFDSLIETHQIKALTKFLDKSPSKEIKDLCLRIFKGESICKPEKKLIVKKQFKTKEGGVYIIYFGNGLWKFGMVTVYERIQQRISEHKNKIVKYKEDFKSFIDNRECINNVITFFESKTPNPKSEEENILKILEDNKEDKIIILQSNKSQNESREFFICNDMHHIYKLSSMLNK